MKPSLKVALSLLFIVIFSFLLGCANPGRQVKSEDVAHDVLAGRTFRVAVLPLENLSGKTAPLKDLRDLFIQRISAYSGISVLGEEETKRFMERQRVRYVGGIDSSTAKAFKDEERIDGVLITSLELYNEDYPPQISVISRLVSTGDVPHILWMDSISMAGDESPGVLLLGIIANPYVLSDKAVGVLSSSLALSLSRKEGRVDMAKARKKYSPKIIYQQQFVQSGKEYTVAVAPFFNESLRKNAGEILLLHFVEELVRQKNVRVVEPGVTRQKFLNYRVIMYEGISLVDADAVLLGLGADLILGGKVIDYEDQMGELADPKVDFSVMAIQSVTKKLIWASKSFNRGNDGVFFYDCGKVYTAGTLASEMARGVVDRMFIAQNTEQREGAR